jgi:hypothetical protein
MPDRFQILDTRTNQLVFTAQPLRTKMIAKRVRREVARLTNEPTRFIVIPGPEHRKWKAPGTSSEATTPSQS